MLQLQARNKSRRAWLRSSYYKISVGKETAWVRLLKGGNTTELSRCITSVRIGLPLNVIHTMFAKDKYTRRGVDPKNFVHARF